MRIILIKDTKLKSLVLPDKISGNFWLTDYDNNGHEKNIICIEAQNNEWILISNDEYSVLNNEEIIPSIILKANYFYVVRSNVLNQKFLIYVENVVDEALQLYDFSDVKEVSVGKDVNNSIVYNLNLVDSMALKIIKDNDKILLGDNSKLGVYVNGLRVDKNHYLTPSDVIFYLGLKIIIIKINGMDFLMVNNPNNLVNNNLKIYEKEVDNSQVIDDENEYDIKLYTEEDYFHKKPRFIQKVEKVELKIDNPPPKENNAETSMLLTIGPMLTMSMTSLVMGYTAINNVLNNGSSWLNALPSLVMCLAMFSSVFVWPMITRKYERNKKRKQEVKRQTKYSEYIESKKSIIVDAMRAQYSILVNKYPKLEESVETILNKQTRLWERKLSDDDFLTLNLGEGQKSLDINIEYDEEHFSLDEDNLKKSVETLSNMPMILNNVPITVSLVNTRLLGIVSTNDLKQKLAQNLIIQLVAFHSYEDLKLVILTSENNIMHWEFVKNLPHNWNDDKSLRYFATNNNEYKEICYNLERILNSYKDDDKKEIKERYVIITDNLSGIRNFEFIKSILENKDDYGFSLIMLENKITNIPTGCESFIELDNMKYSFYETLVNNKPVEFRCDLNLNIDYDACSKVLANIPIKMDNNKNGSLPNKLGFLEMYNVGKIEQLNIENRWGKNNPILSLASPVGYGRSGEIINIDLHEKYHGPHGLIAGMTGSGKSEFIITYILSMAINYHPHEVQFILIDYKGGGLAGAFENSNVKLPHLVGTITNLDVNEIKRSLASIESELKRRQRIFNEARELTKESTVDIYKYQKMYRDGLVNEPVSHLFIISDEFAELKNQQPEFMEQLISTARIGRSLGVHLILATQKPSGVVDPQIWSNSRFRVCLRVQEKGDSNEVIKNPDAAYLKETGRFYFQVGYNEIYVLGQAAWAGGQYYPTENIKKNIDTSLNFIDNIGYVTKIIDSKKPVSTPSLGEELKNIVKYIEEVARNNNIKIKPLWLQKIPSFITVNDLIKEYNYNKESFAINPIIGKYDDPSMQEQRLLTLPITSEGNALIYGIAGSGKENMIATLLYSSMLLYNPSEVNYYIIDFGSQSLKMFKDSPLVGDILTVEDEEKIDNLYKMLNTIIDERKRLFADYNGDYVSYLKGSGNIVPAVVVIINNFESYQETIAKYEEELTILTRDGIRYGVYFIVSLVTPSGMRFKLKQNFNQKFVLEQNSEEDYVTILGNINRNYPSKMFGRGIIKYDNVYEFQTAFITQREEIAGYIKEFINVIKEKYELRARRIPILPAVVTNKDLVLNSDEITIGLSKETLATISYNFEKSLISLIISNDIMINYKFIKPLIKQVVSLKKRVILINALDLDFSDLTGLDYINSNFDNIFLVLEKYTRENFELYKNNNYDKNIFNNYQHIFCVIVGVDSFKNKLTRENKNKFATIFENAKDLGIISYLFVDSVDKIRSMEIEPWYKSCVNQSEGIWLGNGINEQFSLKITQKSPEMRLEVNENFCFVINRGKAILVKYIQDFSD